jgi:ferredoxin/Na+-translocating ferredoxin:NAD+ oxidoreductase RnfG subunit
MRHLNSAAVRLAALFALLATTLASTAWSQTPFSMEVKPEYLKEVLPIAETFSEKEAGDAPVWRGYRNNAETGVQEQVGFVYLTDDYPPEQRGYAGPIDMLVGMDMNGVVTSMKVLDYYESYLFSRGDFIDNSVFLSQFRRKPITDQFRLDVDIDGLSSATATSAAMSRSVGEVSRRVARAYLNFGAGTEEEQMTIDNTRALLEPYSWQALTDQGVIRQTTVKSAEGADIVLAVTYIGKRAIGEFMVGKEAFDLAEADATFRSGGGEILLLAPSGPGAGSGFRQFPMSMQQGDIVRRVAGTRFGNAGMATEGLVAGNANYAVSLTVHPDFDVTQPFNLIYHTPGGAGDVALEYQVTGVGLTLARGEPVLSEEQLLEARLVDASFFERLRLAPPWGVVPWVDVILLSILLGFVMAAFLSKNAMLRWGTMTATMLYLGFYKNGFLSVSHIANVIKMGPEMITNNLPTLMIVVFTLITTLIWGRVFCSSLCPFGAVQDFIARFAPKKWQLKVPQKLHDNALYIKYGILALILGTASVTANASIFQYFEPFGTLFFLSPSVLLWAILLVILAACVVVERFYCRYVCPLGAALAILALVSPLRIKRVPQCSTCKVCEQACPTGAIRREAIDFKECVRCDVCETKLIEKAGTCRHSMDEIERRRKTKQNIPVVNIIEPVSA